MHTQLITKHITIPLKLTFCSLDSNPISITRIEGNVASLLLNRALRSAMKPVGLCPSRELDSVPGTELVLWDDLQKENSTQLLKN